MTKKSAARENNTIFCKWCRTNRNAIRFDKHIESCRSKHLADEERKSLPSAKRARCSSPCPSPSRVAMPMASVDIVSSAPELHIDDEPPIPNPSIFIKVIQHPHSRVTEPTIIPLDSQTQQDASKQLEGSGFESVPSAKPWAPFRTRADFEYTATAVKGLLNKDIVNEQLRGMNDNWTSGTNITFRSHADMAKSLTAARTYGVPFQIGHVSEEFEGKIYHFDFPYRSPREWLISIVTDPTLARSISWYPVQKFLCRGSDEMRIFDQPNSAKKWWDVQSRLPEIPDLPHCFLPMILWMDKGYVTKRVKKHPILLRAAFLPSEIRNASGNGGGVLIGYMPVIADPGDPADRNSARTLEYANFKRNVYHKVVDVIFDPMKGASYNGMALYCGDKIKRVLYPGIPIEALDGEEACSACACRAALANYPCPRCLVHHNQLDMIDKKYPPRTTETMQRVYQDSQTAGTKTLAEDILKEFGLHATKNAFWELGNSDPYKASSYDPLHSDDGGKWGKHLWPLTLDVLRQRGMKGTLAVNMRNVPRWPNLKHFNNVTTIEYTDGQAFLDILKCIIPCMVQLMPKDSALVHCVRAYARYRMMIGLHCMTEERIARLKRYIADYKTLCSRVTQAHDKDFKFYKQHAVGHVIEDIEQKGTTNNYNTRPGEGFFQEVEEAYRQTNMRDENMQMAQIDENQEVIARIRMTIDNYDKARRFPNAEDDEIPDQDEQDKLDAEQRHWSLGAPEHITTAKALEQDVFRYQRNRFFRQFDSRLKSFLREHISADSIGMDEPLKVQGFKCLYLRYQSLEDWTVARDIVRCNPKFHGEERYDCVAINMDSDHGHVPCARLQLLLRCVLSSGDKHDVAVVRMFKRGAWRPNTSIAGCPVLEEANEPRFVMLKYLIWGAHLIPIFCTKEGRFFLNDLVDADMFLRAGN